MPIATGGSLAGCCSPAPTAAAAIYKEDYTCTLYMTLNYPCTSYTYHVCEKHNMMRIHACMCIPFAFLELVDAAAIHI